MKVDIKRLGEIVLCDAISDAPFLNDPVELERVCLRALKKGDCGIIEDKKAFHQFRDENHAGDGITGLVIIKESHFHISTWPEKNYKYVQLDINTCGETAKAIVTLGYLLHDLKAKKCSIEVRQRGVPLYT